MGRCRPKPGEEQRHRALAVAVAAANGAAGSPLSFIFPSLWKFQASEGMRLPSSVAGSAGQAWRRYGYETDEREDEGQKKQDVRRVRYSTSPAGWTLQQRLARDQPSAMPQCRIDLRPTAGKLHHQGRHVAAMSTPCGRRLEIRETSRGSGGGNLVPSLLGISSTQARAAWAVGVSTQAPC